MSLRYFTAERIFDGENFLPANSLLVFDSNNHLADVITPENSSYHSIEPAQVMRYDGVLLPGLINVHCHLELSHLKGKIPKNTGLAGFVREIQQQRKASKEEIEAACRNAILEMKQSGVVAVGDIANDLDCFRVKAASGLSFYNFIEVFGFAEERSEQYLNRASELLKHSLGFEQHAETRIFKSRLTAHASYSTSGVLIRAISAQLTSDDVFSIHLQETESEFQLFSSKTGPMAEFLKQLNLLQDNWEGHPKGSVPFLLQNIRKEIPGLFIHNTFLNQDDINTIRDSGMNFFAGLCPAANLYIEHRLPPVDLLRKNGISICVGTDSLASNDQLSMAHELFLIHQHWPDIPLAEMLKWVTSNGAKALGFEKHLGYLRKGARPGLCELIVDLDKPWESQKIL
jgi:aminodeoxyfutalosine deaminase